MSSKERHQMDRPMTHTIERVATNTIGMARPRRKRRECRLTPKFIILDDGDIFFRETGRRKLSAEMRVFSTTYSIRVDLTTLQEGI